MNWQKDWLADCENEFRLRDRDFSQRQNNVIANFARNGALSSSMAGRELYLVFDQEMTDRSEIMVTLFNQRLAVKSSVEGVDFGTMAQCVEDVMKRSYDHLYQTTRISQYLVQFGLQAQARDSESNLELVVERAKSRILLAGEMAMKKQTEFVVARNNVTVKGHNNVVVTSSPGAQVQVSFNPTALIAALEQLRIAIESSSEAEMAKDDLLEVISDCRSEAEKAKPNGIKISGMLSAVATTVQTFGSLKAAYDLFKGSAALAGINLP